MKFLQAWFVCAVLLFTAACSSDDLAENMPGEFKVIGNIAASAPMSRMQMADDGSGSFTAKDQNTLFFHNGNDILSTMTYEYGQTYFWYDLNLPTETKTCKLAACYPVVSTSTPASFVWNVSTQSANPDLLVAPASEVTVLSTTPVQLTFGHVMHKMVVELSSEESDLTTDVLGQAQIRLQQYFPATTVNLLTGETSGASGDKTSATRTGQRAAFVVPSQAVGEMQVEVSLKGKTETFKLSECKISGQPLLTLEKGKSFVLKIKVTKGGFVIDSSSITGWGDQGSFEDSFII